MKMPRKLRKAHARKCPACGGTGKSQYHHDRACRHCLGDGKIYVREERQKTDWLAELNARVDQLRTDA